MNRTLEGRKVVVIGGGWSGIASAWYLRRAGAEVELIEAGPRLGGRSGSVALGDRSVTLGGKNVGATYRRFREFVDEHGPAVWEPFGISTSQLRGGKIVPIDGEHRLRATLRMLARARPAEAIRLLRCARAIRADGANRFLDSPLSARAERVGNPPLSEVFSGELAANLVRPMTVRMNGAELDESYLGNFGTNLALVLDRFEQLSEGFEPVLDRFADSVALSTGTVVRGVRPRRDGAAIVLDGGDGVSDVEADAVVVATPAPAAAELIRAVDAEAARALDEIPYYPVGVVVAEYEQEIFGTAARALVFPEGHMISNAGAYGKADLGTVRYTFSGRAARPLLARSPGTAELLRLGEEGLGAYLPWGGRPAHAAVSAVWRQGLCAYGPWHRRLGDQLRSVGGASGSIAFAGDYLAGASIEACFVSAERAVAALVDGAAAAR